MKFIICLAVFVCTAITSCKKDANNSFYVQADFNGINEKFTDDAFAQESFGDITAGFSIQAKNNPTNHSLSLNIQHSFNQHITAGTYDKNSVPDFYVPAAGYTIGDTLFGSGVNTNNPFPMIITILTLTNKSASGTFSGIIHNDQNVNDSIIISNGKFLVPFYQ